MEGTSGDGLVTVSCPKQGQLEHAAQDGWLLNSSKDGGFRTSLGNLFQRLTTITIKMGFSDV